MKNFYRSGLFLVGFLMLVATPLSAGAQYAPAPTCKLWAEKSSYSIGETVILYWSSQNANFAVFNQGSGLLLPSAQVPANGTQTITANVSGNQVVTLQFHGAGGNTSCTTTIQTKSATPPPIIATGVFPLSIILGQSTKLYWNVSNAESCVLTYDLTEEKVALVESRMISPTQTTVYSLTCTNSEGVSTSQAATAYVTAKSPTCSIATNKPIYQVGEKMILSWEGENATHASFQQEGSALSLPAEKLKIEDSREVMVSAAGAQKVILWVYNAIGSGSCSVIAYVKSSAGSAPATTQAATPTATAASASCTALENSLKHRSTDVQTNGEVTKLQKFLQTKGFLNSEPTGFFGALTEAAVKAFQLSVGFETAGNVGPLTRAKIKALTCL